jgi:hypothetical protein
MFINKGNFAKKALEESFFKTLKVTQIYGSALMSKKQMGGDNQIGLYSVKQKQKVF